MRYCEMLNSNSKSNSDSPALWSVHRCQSACLSNIHAHSAREERGKNVKASFVRCACAGASRSCARIRAYMHVVSCVRARDCACACACACCDGRTGCARLHLPCPRARCAVIACIYRQPCNLLACWVAGHTHQGMQCSAVQCSRR